MAKGKKEKQSILLKPLIFLVIGFIDFLFFCFTYYYFGKHPFFDPTGNGGLKILSLQLTILLISSIIFTIYGFVLKIVTKFQAKKALVYVFEFISLTLIVFFIIVLVNFVRFWYDPSLSRTVPNPNWLY